eukprot:14214769-Ditylum_brightwellii.AAC.1
MLNSVPEDMSQIIISIFKTCSIEPFRHLFLTLNDQMHISGKHLIPEEICSIAECDYRSIKLAGDWGSILVKAMLSEKKGSKLVPEKEPKGGKGTICTGPRFQPPKAGRPEWCIFYRKVMFWCNVCGYWNPMHFTKKKEGVSVKGYLDNATVNSHQHRI